MSENVVDYLLELLEKKGSDIQYGNEDVTQLEHALQCAELAEQNNKSDALLQQHCYMILVTFYTKIKIQFMKVKTVSMKI